jgi:hypothetical protein
VKGVRGIDQGSPLSGKAVDISGLALMGEEKKVVINI